MLARNLHLQHSSVLLFALILSVPCLLSSYAQLSSSTLVYSHNYHYISLQCFILIYDNALFYYQFKQWLKSRIIILVVLRHMEYSSCVHLHFMGFQFTH
jgi:hypothetical protein